MKKSYLLSYAIVGTALLFSAYSGNPWAAIAPGVLFVFVAFPRWRGKLYRLVDKAIVAATGRINNDSSDPR